MSAPTEVVRNSLSASFSTPIRINYFFERSQIIAVDIYDSDGPSNSLLHHDYLGSAELSVPALVRAEGKCLRLPLKMDSKPGAFCGYVTVIAENKASRKFLARMDIGVNIYRRPTLFSRFGGPYLIIKRQTSSANGHWISVFRSKLPGRRDKSWDKFAYIFDDIRESFELLSLSRDDTQLLFEIAVSVRSRDRIVASSQMSFREWQDGGNYADLFRPGPLGSPTVRQDGKPKGQIRLRNFNVSEEPQFVDYIMGGCEISLVIGIDFTASNGDSMQPSSLHFCDQYRPNEYELAIRTVGDILAGYDSDNRFPAYGFGAKLPPDYASAQHCFSLTGNEDPTCYEIDGVLDAYRQSLYNVRLSGPTEFGLLVQTAAKHAHAEMLKYAQAYTILLIVTDGVINDFDETTRAIVEASHLPLSIVIIGVGDADFTAMDALDGDDIPLSRTRCRDIVQFVPFREYQGKPDMLVSKVLEEIPKQLVEYMTLNGIAPNPARPMPPEGDIAHVQAVVNANTHHPQMPPADSPPPDSVHMNSLNHHPSAGINVAADAASEEDDYGMGSPVNQAAREHFAGPQEQVHSHPEDTSAQAVYGNEPAYGPVHARHALPKDVEPGHEQMMTNGIEHAQDHGIEAAQGQDIDASYNSGGHHHRGFMVDGGAGNPVLAARPV